MGIETQDYDASFERKEKKVFIHPPLIANQFYISWHFLHNEAGVRLLNGSTYSILDAVMDVSSGLRWTVGIVFGIRVSSKRSQVDGKLIHSSVVCVQSALSHSKLETRWNNNKCWLVVGQETNSLPLNLLNCYHDTFTKGTGEENVRLERYPVLGWAERRQFDVLLMDENESNPSTQLLLRWAGYSFLTDGIKGGKAKALEGTRQI